MKVKRVDPLQKPKVETADAIANDAHWPPGGMSSIRHTANDVATPKLWLKTQRVTRLVIGVIGSLFLNIAQIWFIFTGHGTWASSGMGLSDVSSNSCIPQRSCPRRCTVSSWHFSFKTSETGRAMFIIPPNGHMLMRKISAMVLINIDKILINQWMELMEWCILSAHERKKTIQRNPSKEAGP